MIQSESAGLESAGTTDEPLIPTERLAQLVTETMPSRVMPDHDEYRVAAWAIQDTIERVGEVA